MSADFPTKVTEQLRSAVARLKTTLTNDIAQGASTIPVTSTTGFPDKGFITIDNETKEYTGKTATTFTGCTNLNGTDVAHDNESEVKLTMSAAHINRLNEELIATQTYVLTHTTKDFIRDTAFAAKTVSVAADRYTLLTPNRMLVYFNSTGFNLSSQQEIDLSTSASWDTTAGTDYTVAANRAGTDFYVYACDNSGTLELLVSADSSSPDGYNTTTSKKIAGFHCLCTAVGTIAGHDLTGYVQGDILPQSVWDIDHRPLSDPEGMVYDPKTNIWWDIYLASWDSGLESVYNATIVDGDSNPKLHWYNFVEEFAEVKKRLPFQQEFMRAALGSPQQTSISGSADPGTTGGHSDTGSQRIISNIGCEDMTGVMWQWGADGGATTDVGSSWEVADTDGTAGSLDEDESIGRGQHYEAPNRPFFGGSWSGGMHCGSRSSRWNHSPLYFHSSRGARGVSEPKIG